MLAQSSEVTAFKTNLRAAVYLSLGRPPGDQLPWSAFSGAGDRAMMVNVSLGDTSSGRCRPVASYVHHRRCSTAPTRRADTQANVNMFSLSSISV